MHPLESDRLICHLLLAALLALISMAGCQGKPPLPSSPAPDLSRTSPVASSKPLAPMGYAIQVGAFSNLNNAVRQTEALQKEGLDAYYFVHKTGLYKVRFGDFPFREEALVRAKALQRKGIIDVYYIVSPQEYPTGQIRDHGSTHLRTEIVRTAKSFLGVPYRWGGSTPKEGFDCSGLTMAVYQLNGLHLPRSSAQQWLTGTPIRQDALSKADLVFFATSGGVKITHVGIYVGDDRFIHAPRKGEKIRFDSLSNGYFKKRYMGARTYL